jgi:hypothetical protein
MPVQTSSEYEIAHALIVDTEVEKLLSGVICAASKMPEIICQ